MSSDPFALSRPPDLVVGDLRLWIVNRQFPENQDYWDGNWLDVRAIVQRGATSVQATGTILHLGDISRFLAELKTLSAELAGTASSRRRPGSSRRFDFSHLARSIGRRWRRGLVEMTLRFVFAT